MMNKILFFLMQLVSTETGALSAHDQVTAIEWTTVTAHPTATSFPKPTGTITAISFGTVSSIPTAIPTVVYRVEKVISEL